MRAELRALARKSPHPAVPARPRKRGAPPLPAGEGEKAPPPLQLNGKTPYYRCFPTFFRTAL